MQPHQQPRGQGLGCMDTFLASEITVTTERAVHCSRELRGCFISSPLIFSYKHFSPWCKGSHRAGKVRGFSDGPTSFSALGRGMPSSQSSLCLLPCFSLAASLGAVPRRSLPGDPTFSALVSWTVMSPPGFSGGCCAGVSPWWWEVWRGSSAISIIWRKS